MTVSDFDLTPVEVNCISLPKDHFVQVPLKYINVQYVVTDHFFSRLALEMSHILHTTQPSKV